MNDHVTKPINPDQLFATLLKWIKPAAERSADPQSLPAAGEAAELEAHTETAQAAPVTDELPESLPGFNLTAGIERLVGNKRLYRKLLMDFGTKYTETAGEIRDALGANDFEHAHSLIHNLKGLAGNLEATDLQAAAVELEKLVKGQTAGTVSAEVLSSTFSELEGALNLALEAVQTLGVPIGTKNLKDSGDDASAATFQLEKAMSDRIQAAAEMGDVMQIKSISEELITASDAAVPFCEELIRLAEDFDFDGIQKLALDSKN